MGVMTAWIGMALATVLGAAISRQIADEFKAWTPWLVDFCIRYAILGLPADCRDRLDEEWRSHVGEIPGEIGKVLSSVGFIVASRRIGSTVKSANPQASDQNTALQKTIASEPLPTDKKNDREELRRKLLKSIDEINEEMRTEYNQPSFDGEGLRLARRSLYEALGKLSI